MFGKNETKFFFDGVQHQTSRKHFRSTCFNCPTQEMELTLQDKRMFEQISDKINQK